MSRALERATHHTTEFEGGSNGRNSNISAFSAARNGKQKVLSNDKVNGDNRRRKRTSEVVVGERIRRLRTDAGLSQEELGRSSQMSTSYISRLETGEVNPTVDALLRIVRVFGMSIDELIEFDTSAEKKIQPDDLDPEVRFWLYKLKGRKISNRTKRILQTIIEEELNDKAD